MYFLFIFIRLKCNTDLFYHNFQIFLIHNFSKINIISQPNLQGRLSEFTLFSLNSVSFQDIGDYSSPHIPFLYYSGAVSPYLLHAFKSRIIHLLDSLLPKATAVSLHCYLTCSPCQLELS